MKRQLKRETPKNYSFLDLVAPSYNRIKITPKFDGGGPTMTEPTMFMPPQSLNSGQPAFIKNPNVFDWSIQEYVDPGNRLWEEHKKLFPNHKDGSKYHEYFLCDLNPDMCGGPNPQFRGMRTSKNPEVQNLVKELDPLFDIPGSKKYPYTLENFLSHGSRDAYRPNISETSKTGLFNFNKDQQQKLQRLYDLALQESGNTVIPDSKYYNGYRIQWNSPTDRYYKNQANNMYAANENLANSADNWNNRSVSNEPFPIAKQMEKYPNASKFFFDGAPLNTTQVDTPQTKVGITLPQVSIPSIINSTNENTNTKVKGFKPFDNPVNYNLETTKSIFKNNLSSLPITQIENSPLNPNYVAPKSNGFSMQNSYDPNKEYALDWLQKQMGIDYTNDPMIDESTLGPDFVPDNNYRYTSSTLKLNGPIQNTGIANLPKQNQWDNLIEPLPVQRPSEYADPQQEVIGSIKTDFKPGDTKTDSKYMPYNINPFTTGLNILNAGLNTVGGMRNMRRINRQENLNSFITQQPEAVYPNKRMLYGDKSMFAEYGGEYSHGGMYPDGGSVYDPDAYVGTLVQYKKGGIYIKPENKGKFTAWAQSHGMSVQEAASHVMANKEKYSSTIVKRANFAKNASKWKHEKGGEVDNDKEMVEGVADILSKVKDVDNRKELANYMVNQFDDENVDYDYDQFLQATNLMEMAYGGMYSYGGHYIPQDVPYLAGKFVPNRIDLEILANGGMIKRADGSYSKRGLWDNIRANKGSGKKPTKEMLKQERKIKKSYKAGGEYMEGNEYEISGEELERLRSLGYDIELI